MELNVITYIVHLCRTCKSPQRGGLIELLVVASITRDSEWSYKMAFFSLLIVGLGVGYPLIGYVKIRRPSGLAGCVYNAESEIVSTQLWILRERIDKLDSLLCCYMWN
jgi:hypothetical protein